MRYRPSSTVSSGFSGLKSLLVEDIKKRVWDRFRIKSDLSFEYMRPVRPSHEEVEANGSVTLEL